MHAQMVESMTIPGTNTNTVQYNTVQMSDVVYCVYRACSDDDDDRAVRVRVSVPRCELCHSLAPKEKKMSRLHQSHLTRITLCRPLRTTTELHVVGFLGEK